MRNYGLLTIAFLIAVGVYRFAVVNRMPTTANAAPATELLVAQRNDEASAAAGSAATSTPGNLLRNGDFQDDWLTLLSESKNHNWNYPSDFYNRRDYNPDGWTLKGNWTWLNADAPRGGRRLMLKGSGTRVAQGVNWCVIHDPRPPLGAFPDAGGYPRELVPRSKAPERLVRDVTLKVRIKGEAVPTNGGTVQLTLVPGEKVPDDKAKLLIASAAIPEGTYDWKWVTVEFPAAKWLDAVRSLPPAADAAAPTGPGEGALVPGRIEAAIDYSGATGSVEVGGAQLTAAASPSPNLLANGGFENVSPEGYPTGWSQQSKYRYFPPGYYYIFNTWHNTSSDNRGPVMADSLIAAGGARSLKMIVATGDEKSVQTEPIVLNQKETRLIEVNAQVKTDSLAMMQIDAVNEKGERLPAYNFIQKMPNSIGTDEWRAVRQIIRPLAPLQSIRLRLCARGMNGFTLGGTGLQPQGNAVGTIWWDNVTVTEPESTPDDLRSRGVKTEVTQAAGAERAYLSEVDPGERLLGDNVLSAVVNNQGRADSYALQWEFTSPSGRKAQFKSAPQKVSQNGRAVMRVPYQLTQPCPDAYTEYRGTLTLLDGRNRAVAASPLWFGMWTEPIDMEIGGCYLRPGQHQFVRMNLGFTQASLQRAASVRLDVVRRGSGEVLRSKTVDATPAVLTAQREKIPAELREDFTNLLLADFDVAFLPMQPFNDPQRNWFIRATLLDTAGKAMATVDSAPFCRLDHEPKQPAIQSVAIDNDNLLSVNGQPWMPWGVTYGHNPIYEGPADPGAGKYRDLKNLPVWSIYDRHGGTAASRANNDLNCIRYVAGSVTPIETIKSIWDKDNLYCSSAFVAPDIAFSVEDLVKPHKDRAKLDEYLAFCKNTPNVVSVAPGVEEAFGNFTAATPEKLAGLKQVVELIKAQSNRLVMVGHGGYWNPFEFEKVPFFDIYDPETEPLYPAPVHTDLMPLIKGQQKTVWLRPQMYENVPYERWRYHVWVELMRGTRGWQIAHGPGDPTLFRGLHAEMEFIKPVVYSKDAGPEVSIEPWIEHWSRRYNGKTYIIAATTHGLTTGRWRWADAGDGLAAGTATPLKGRVRLTSSPDLLRQEDNGYGIGDTKPFQSPTNHSIQWLPNARSWPRGSKIVQWVRLDPQAAPKNLVIVAKANHRWSHAASLGEFDGGIFHKDMGLAAWFMRAFYRNASGFLGWGDDMVPKLLEFVPGKATPMGALPAAGGWVKLEIPLEQIDAAEQLLDGIGFMHDGGRVYWGPTSIAAPDGVETLVWGSSLQQPQDQLAKTRISVTGLKAGTRVRALFEDREIVTGDGFFTDDFRGRDLYQRFGGSTNGGYSDEPVALHVYEVP